MRKKLNLLFVLILGVLLLVSLAACGGTQDVGKLPNEVNPGGGVNSPNLNLAKADAYLTFTSPKQLSSVLSAIFVDEFNIEDINYTIVYTDGKTTTTVNGGALSIDMVDPADVDLLSTPGHHMIHVSQTLENGKTATGSFALHLKDRAAEINLVTLTFNLRDGQSNKYASAYFGTTDREHGYVSVQAEQGSYFASWDEFVRTYRMALDGKALSKLTYDNGVLSATQGFENGFELTKNMSFTTVWTDDVISVSFDLKVPADATLMTGYVDPKTFDVFTTPTKVERNLGRIVSPKLDTFNVYNGYYFAGWYVDDGDGDFDNDVMWNFSQTVGKNDINLYAKWTKRVLSFTLYTMGGVYPQNTSNSIVAGREITSEDVANSLNLEVVESSTRFAVGSGEINRIVVSGLTYGRSYANYVVKVAISQATDTTPEKVVFLTFGDLVSKLEKGAGDYVKVEQLYGEFQCQNAVVLTDIVSDATGKMNDIGYVKWVFDEPSKSGLSDEEYNAAYLDKMSRYMSDVIFKNGMSVKNDGSVRLDKVADATVNEIIIPATIIFEGEERKVSEIGAKACTDLKALVTVDASRACNLKIVADEAFSHCPSLSKIVIPTENNVVTVGQKVFYNTHFELNYQSEHFGSQFIIFKDILYKYVGDKNPGTTLDLSGDYYTEENAPNMSAERRAAENLALANVKKIAAGAFDNWKNLETITLHDNIERLEDYSFANLPSLKNIIVGAGSHLSYIGDHAFDNSTKYLTTASGQYNATYHAIIIGNTFYRFIDREATSAVIPAGIKYIAGRAFVSCGNIAHITFEDEQSIVSIGKDAFFNTAWIQENDGVNIKNGFVVINNTLAEYYNDRFDSDNVNIIIPDEIDHISVHAFNTYAQHVRTIQFGTNVKKIDDYAFIGAASLSSLIFTNATYEDGKLVGVPDINEKTFSTYDDTIVNSIRIFFRDSVIDALNTLANNFDKIDEIQDVATKHWVQFYSANREIFVAEDVQSVWIDNKVIATQLMRTGLTGNAYYDRYGYTPVENALVVESNTGIVRHEALERGENQLSFVYITETGAFADYYEEGKLKAVLTFKYHDSTKGCAINAGDEHLFVLEIYQAVKDDPGFYQSSVYPASESAVHGANNLSNLDSTYWFEDSEGNVLNGQVDGADIPTFYTSFGDLDVVFVYNDIINNVHRLPARVIGFSTNTEKSSVAYFSVNFHGLGTYRFYFNYAIVESKIVSVQQSMSVSIPLNGNATTQFGRYDVNLVGEDGIASPIAITPGNFTVVKIDGVPTNKMVTNVLGKHVATMTYTKSDALEPLEFELIYNVILDIDMSLFTYEVVSEIAGTARITSCSLSARNSDTIIVPGICKINGKEYTITEIGGAPNTTTGVFQDFTNLKEIYLSTTIKKIGIHTFVNCTKLEHVYTAVVAGGGVTDIAKSNFVELRTVSETSTRVVKEVALASLSGVTYLESPYNDTVILSVGSTYEFTDERGRTLVYKIVEVSGELTINRANALVYMPDTIFHEYTIKNLATNETVSPIVYSSASGYRIRTREYVPPTLTHIGIGAFSYCESLRDFDLSHATSLQYIGVGAFSYSGIEEIDLSNSTSLTELNNQTFRFCTSLRSFKVHDGISVIGANCFNACTSLETFTTVHHATNAEDSDKINVNYLCVANVANDAFNQCTSLTEMTLTNDIVTMQTNAFSACTALTLYCTMIEANKPSGWALRWSGDCPIVWDCTRNDVANNGLCYIVVDGIRYSYDPSTNVASVARQRSSLTVAEIPATIVGRDNRTYTVDTIGESAFEGTMIEKVVVSSEMKYILNDAFQNCASLQLFLFADENNLLTINNTAFSGCNALVNAPTITA